MASKPTGDKTAPAPQPERRVWKATSVAALLPAIIRPGLKGRAPGIAQMLADWPAIVGPELAAQTLPRRLSGATLVIGCGGPMAMELQHRSAQIIERINLHAGRIIVERLRFVQDFTPPAPRPPRPVASPEAVARVAVRVADIPAGPLRDALARLGETVASRAAAPISRDSKKHF